MELLSSGIRLAIKDLSYLNTRYLYKRIMTYARSEIFDPEEIGIYHCISRCVRRAFLCGKDPFSGKSFEHRRKWIRNRLKVLADIFAIEVVSYAVMSNHLHSLIRARPDISKGWSNREVAIRWRRLFPLRRIDGKPANPSAAEISVIADDNKLIKLYRERLSDISWFNRCLNENIARRANAEDECKGRFWEGRFKCQKVFDINGLLTCSVYVDLNPIRAGMARTPEESDFTSIQQRIIADKKQKFQKAEENVALVSIEEITDDELTLDEYLNLVDQTGRMIIEGKGKIPAKIAPILTRLKIAPENWIETTRDFRFKFRRVVGPVDRIKAAARQMKKSWFHGIEAARMAFA